MPWCCPACRTLIRPQLTAAGEDVPRPDKIYTCVVCRLPLVLAEDGAPRWWSHHYSKTNL